MCNIRLQNTLYYKTCNRHINSIELPYGFASYAFDLSLSLLLFHSLFLWLSVRLILSPPFFLFTSRQLAKSMLAVYPPILHPILIVTMNHIFSKLCNMLLNLCYITYMTQISTTLKLQKLHCQPDTIYIQQLFSMFYFSVFLLLFFCFSVVSKTINSC